MAHPNHRRNQRVNLAVVSKQLSELVLDELYLLGRELKCEYRRALLRIEK